jgi:threonine synthase
MIQGRWPGVIQAYSDFLPVTAETPIITLNEGNTPLVKSTYLGPRAKIDLYFKLEGLNPTGSFKDRGMTMAVSKALEEGSKMVMCASTGNTSASAAAYAARAGIGCVVLIPKGAIARGKLAQALVHNATVIAVEGNFDDALSIVRTITAEHPVTLVNSLNPFRIAGQKTGAFEVCDQLGRHPDALCIPVGNAGNITAYWQGFREFREAGKVDGLPRMLGFQAAGAAPIVLGKVIDNPETIATAIRIGNPASWDRATSAAKDSGGSITAVTDDEITKAYRALASKEGLFVEPASAASVAGVAKALERGEVDRGSTAVCVLTGHGLKDPDMAIRMVEEPKTLPPRVENVVEYLGLEAEETVTPRTSHPA